MVLGGGGWNFLLFQFGAFFGWINGACIWRWFVVCGFGGDIVARVFFAFCLYIFGLYFSGALGFIF